MRPLMSRTIAALLLGMLVSACGSTPRADAGSESAATVEVAASPLDMSSLVPRERAALERLLDETIAPCPDQAVTLAVCLKEQRPCKACDPAARFLAERVKAGFDRKNTQRAYGLRFGSDVRSIEVAGSPTKGPDDAPVTIMLWSDFECPACRRAVPVVTRIASAHAKDVRLVHKLYPLERHPHAEVAARAAFAAHQQGKYWPMEERLFENQDRLSESTIGEFAEELGLDMKKFSMDMASEAAKKTIERDKNDADKSGLSGTPFILINGREFDLGLFQLEPDLDAWVTMEIEMAQKP